MKGLGGSCTLINAVVVHSSFVNRTLTVGSGAQILYLRLWKSWRISTRSICHTTIEQKQLPRGTIDARLPTPLALHRWPTIVPRDPVPAKLLLTISISNIRVNIVVVKDPAFNRIVINTLSARRVNIAMRLKNNVSTASQTRCASSIDLQTIISTYPTASGTTKGRLTNPPVAEDDLQTLILYSAPGAGRSVSR